MTRSSGPSRPTITAGRTTRSTFATASAASRGTCRFRRARATFRASASPSSTRARTLRSGRRGRCRRACFNELRIGVNALRRENLPQSAGFDAFADLGITGPTLPPVDQGYHDVRRARLRDAGRRSEPSRGAPDANDPHLRQPHDRARPASRQGWRRAPALQVRRLQPPVRARPGCVPGRLHGTLGRAICCSASRPSRCSPRTTTGRRCGPGRPTSTCRTTGASRRGSRSTPGCGTRSRRRPTMSTIAWRS